MAIANEKEVFQAERKHLGLDHDAQPKSSPWALCLSGGGIRSATFSLGVLQGLAQRKLLSQFHYLSTVSGGGYIGSWLSRWIAEASGNVAAVESALAGGTDSAIKVEPPQVRNLRSYSNYLSPVWGLSSDFFTLISTFLRNLLLNWSVLVPLLAALVLLPRIYLGAAVALEPPALLADTVIALAVTLVWMGIAYVVADLPSEVAKSQKEVKDLFVPLCFLPIFGAAILLGLAAHWNESALHRLELWEFMAAGALLHASGCAAGVIVRKARGMGERAMGNARSGSVTWAGDLAFIGLSGALGGALVYAFVQWLATGSGTDAQEQRAVTFMVPGLLFGFWLATSLYVALGRRASSENDREWWARSGGWWLRAALGWIVCFGLVIYLPQWLLRIPGVTPESLLTGGGIGGVLIGAIGYWTKNGAKVTAQAQGLAAKLGARVLDLAAIAFILLLLVGLCFAMDYVLEQATAAPVPATTAAVTPKAVVTSPPPIVYGVHLTGRQGHLQSAALLFVGLVFGCLVMSLTIGVNTFSLHSMYGNRLVRAYFGAARVGANRRPHWFTGFEMDDNIDMGSLKAAETSPHERRLFHVVNLALNLVAPSGNRLEWQQRKAASFTVSPLFSGSAVLGYQESASYSAGISLGRAMTISGAAAASNMGYHSSPVVAFVMTFFNARLGWWLPNTGPAGKRAWRNSEPNWSLRPLLWEALGRTTDSRPYVYVSDGGHFDNLGLYEMVKRGCRRILVVDASADPRNGYDDLQETIRRIRVDLGVTIKLPADALSPALRYAVGKIRYPEADEADMDGELYYLKPTLCDDEPIDVRHYAKESAARDGENVFPHQSTADQFFDERQFESYRMLGLHTVEQVFKGVKSDVRWPGFEDYKTHIKPAIVPAGQEARTNQTSGSTDVANERVPAFAKISDAARSMSQRALLASAAAIGGAVGITGTVVLKDRTLEVTGRTLELKDGTRLAIDTRHVEDLARRGIPLTPSQELRDGLAVTLGDLKTVLSTQNYQSAHLLKLTEIIHRIDKQLGETRRIEPNDLAAFKQAVDGITKAIDDLPSKLPKPDEFNKNLFARLREIDDKLTKINQAVGSSPVRRNVRGIEGVER
jgi:hypothetical protein